MDLQTILVLSSLALTGIVAVGLAVHFWGQRPSLGASSLAVIMFGVIAYTLAFVIHLLTPELNNKILWYNLSLLGSSFIAPAWFTFSIEYTRGWYFSKKLSFAWVMLIPFGSIALAWTNRFHQLYWTNFRIESGPMFEVLCWDNGPGYWTHLAYAYLLVSIGIWLLVRSAVGQGRFFQKQNFVLIIGALIPLVFDISFAFGFSPIPELDLAPFAFVFSVLIWKIGLDHYKFMDIRPVARNLVIKSLEDGFIILDQQQRIIDLNPKAEDYLGRNRAEIFGMQLSAELLSWYEEISEGIKLNQDQDIEIRDEKASRVTKVLVRPIIANDQQQVGTLITLRDISLSAQAEKTIQESEHYMSAVFESVQDGISVLSPDLTIERVNGVMNSWYEDNLPVVGQKCFQAYHDKDVPCDPCPTLRCLETGNTEREVVPGLPGSDIEWLELYSFPMKDQETGEVTGVVEFVRDITEQTRAQKEIQSVNQHLHATLDALPDLMFEFDNQGRFVDYRAPDDGLLYAKPEDFIGKSIADVMPPEVAKLGQEAIRRIQETGEVSRMTFSLEMPDGTKWFESNIAAAGDPKSDEVNFVMLSRDVTERVITEEKLKNFNRELEERVLERTADLAVVNKELEAFSYSVSHDLRAPLRAIQGFSEIIQTDYSDELSDVPQGFLDRITTATQKMNQLIEDLLTLSKLGRQEIRPETVDLAKIAKKTYHNLIAGYEGRKVDFQVEECESIQADPNLIEVLMTNLISNALKYSRNREQTTIKLGNYQEESKTVFYLQDNGIGFDMEYARTIFAPFQRLHAGEEFEGSGIGLAIVKRIVDQHNGDIWVESELDKGTTVYFKL